ncbi:MAG: hypothetical protein ACQETE_01310 [Bacteroidota bacterium]
MMVKNGVYSVVDGSELNREDEFLRDIGFGGAGPALMVALSADFGGCAGVPDIIFILGGAI